MQSGAGNGANQIAAVLHSNIFTRDYVDVGSGSGQNLVVDVVG